MIYEQVDRLIMAGIVLAVAAMIGAVFGLLFAGLRLYALTITV